MLSLGFKKNNSYLKNRIEKNTDQYKRIQPNTIARSVFEFLLHLYYLQYLIQPIQLVINKSVFNC